ncbi:MAG: hypothetical protein F2799_07325 [Actinobacteria bacterium]|uniref:Unannotated protein n=1 Tax=freshwater metagenome TaxID=449393 RepID=A0A6J7EPA7_9ZZZZ|nr:hypothetical protein [Actinomycetota bacterium]
MTKTPFAVVAGLGWRRARTGAIAWGLVFALSVVAIVAAYSAAYGTPEERQQLFRLFGANKGISALFGSPRGLDTVGGFTAWRSMGFLPLVTAAWGLVIATGALRGEEDEGRRATILAGAISRSRSTAATLTGLGLAGLLLFLITAVFTVGSALINGGFSAGDALFLTLAYCAAGPPFMALGAFTAQIAPNRRQASGIAAAVLGVAYILRIAADADASLSWLRWLTPIGWVMELRPIVDPRAWPLLLLALWTIFFGLLAIRVASGRDDEAAFLQSSSSRKPRTFLLASSLGLALRERLGGLAAWVLGTGLSMFAIGLLSKAITKVATQSGGLQKHIEQTTSNPVDISTPTGYLAVMFVFVVIVVSLHAVGHSNVTAEEEREGRSATALAAPLSRNAWLGGRVGVGLIGCLAVSLAAAIGAWLGSVVSGAGVSLLDMLGAAANMLPAVLLFLGIGFAAFAYVPRHASAIAWSAIGISYLWEQTGAVIKAPEWVLSFSPFHWVKPVPAVDPALTALFVLGIAGIVLLGLAFHRFNRRDLSSK